MAYFFRKSATFGPFRLNFSKSGIGASVGIRGARLTLSSRGTTYVTVGSHGFYYRETLSTRGERSPRHAPTPSRVGGITSPDEITTADTSDLVDSSSERLIQQLNERARKSNPAVILYCLAGLLFLYGLASPEGSLFARMPAIPLLAALGLLIVGGALHQRNAQLRVSRLFYELGGAEQQKYSAVQQALTYLVQCNRLWRIEARSATVDWKRNAGASHLVRRTPISAGNLLPPRVETNISVPCVNMGRIRLYFLPDVVLCWQNGTFGGIGYDDFHVAHGSIRFTEEEGVPADATVVDRTWRYVNKNGGPDRRFNNNRRYRWCSMAYWNSSPQRD
jgi:hypothetical protein